MSIEQWLFAGAAATTVAFFLLAVYSPGTFEPDPDWSASDGCIGGLEHDDSGISHHYHSTLKMSVDDQHYAIPPNTGIDQAGCREGMRWIHVHNSADTGFTTLHIETSERLNVPLGSFFEIWGREGGPGMTVDRSFDINRNGISDWDEYEITMLVNGDESTNYESFIMEEDRTDQIELIFTSK